MAESGIEVEFTPGNFAILRLKRGENRLNSEFLDAFSAALDKVERNSSCRALITLGEGRFYSNGIDLQYASKLDAAGFNKFLVEIQLFLTRLLTFPMPTVAAINGHCFAGGAFIALAHDFRVMRTGFGWISWNEIFINLRIPDYLLELLRTKIPPGAAQLQAAVYGKRFTAEDAVSCGIIDVATKQETLLQEATSLASRSMGREPYDRETMKVFKEDLYNRLVDMAPRASFKSRM